MTFESGDAVNDPPSPNALEGSDGVSNTGGAEVLVPVHDKLHGLEVHNLIEIIGNVRRLCSTPSMTVETLVHSEHESIMGMGSISSQRRELKDDVLVKHRREEML